MFIINGNIPGITPNGENASIENALKVLVQIKKDLKLTSAIFRSKKELDKDGYMLVIIEMNNQSVEVHIPGDDFKTTIESTPFNSRRLYVNGSSWLYGFAIDIISKKLNLES